jgi:hypothetical protein
MSRMIAIPDEVYARLDKEAKVRGLTVPQIVAQLSQEVEKRRIVVTVERLRAKGILLAEFGLLPSVSTGFKPIRVQGKALSETIIEERR